MKFQMVMKTPDVMDMLSKQAEEEATDRAGHPLDAENDADMELYNDVLHEMNAIVQRYISCGEYLTVEFDTTTGVCQGMKRR